ncbi:MAG: serine hydrolase domain-containing protein [Pirellulales bacterium]
MRIALRVVALVLFVSLAATLRADETLPRSAQPDPRFAELEKAALTFRDETGCSAASLAVAQDGKLAYSCAYGWADAAHQRPLKSDALFRIASVSKPFTAALIRKLFDEGKLTPDRTVWDFLALEEPAGAFDARWKAITVGQLLDHRGGWDRAGRHGPDVSHRVGSQRSQAGSRRAPAGRDPLDDRQAVAVRSGREKRVLELRLLPARTGGRTLDREMLFRRA